MWSTLPSGRRIAVRERRAALASDFFDVADADAVGRRSTTDVDDDSVDDGRRRRSPAPSDFGATSRFDDLAAAVGLVEAVAAERDTDRREHLLDRHSRPDRGCTAVVSGASSNDCWTSMVSPVLTNLYT